MNYQRLVVGFKMIVALTCSFSAAQSWADDASQIFTFEKAKLAMGKVSGYDVVRYDDLELTQEIAAPQLPVKLVHLALPAGRDIAEIAITNIESTPLEGEYYLFPAQPPQILSRAAIAFVQPDQSIYSSSTPFPADIVKIAPPGYFSGYNIGALLIYPVQYVPSQKKLIFHSKIEVRLIYEDRQRPPLPVNATRYAESIRKNALKELVKNFSFTSELLPNSAQTVPIRSVKEHVYVIITADALVASFQPLADWKRKKGLSATMVTTSWIYQNYSGVDQPEKIRNFIKYAYQNWGTLWVLLGGDTNMIPARTAFAMDCETGNFTDNFIPCDLYFSDVDGDWNANGNNIYGEVGDKIDMYPEVFVGRASVENPKEAEAFVKKVLTYEKNAGGHQLEMLFLAEVLWPDPYTNSGLGKNHIDSLFVPGRFDPITKLYEALGNENYNTVMAALNAGPNIINHDGHAWYTGMSVAQGFLTGSDLDMLTNAPNFSIFFSIGCWPAAFDYDCVAEHFLTNPKGGGVAFIGNSRYGWGSPGNPLFGYSDRFDQQFFRKLFKDNLSHLGNALATAKAVYVPFSAQENVYRWCEYEINLLGDPEMPVWTDAPRTLTVTCPAELPVGRSFCPITVTEGNQPIPQALVCVMQDTAVYETALTGADGRANLEVTTFNPAGTLHLTVTAQNFVPYETTISLVASGPYVQICSYSTNGSAQGFVTPGDLVAVEVRLRNFGNAIADGVSLNLSCASRNLTMVDSTESAGTILPGDSVVIANAFQFHAGEEILNGEVIYLNLKISDGRGNLWTDGMSVTGMTPVISYFYHTVSDSTRGNGNGFAEPGETITLNLIIQNSGLQAAANVLATLSSNDPGLSFSNATLEFGNVPLSGQRLASTEIAIGAACPAPSFPQLNILFQTDAGYQFADSFTFSVGKIGFHDDMENGEGRWTHSGTIDLWHLTSNRKHSGNYSWYCGVEGQFVYRNNMADNLELMSVIIDQHAELSFWCWYEFPNYGTDGFYVEVNDGTRWTILDFIGSGGALGTLTTGNDWLEYTYDLSHYPAGTSLRLRFRFVSDASDVARGVYLDDVSIRKSKPEITLAVSSPHHGVTHYQLYQNYPNPFRSGAQSPAFGAGNPGTMIRFTLTQPEHAKIEIFDIRGTRIRVLVNENFSAGFNKAIWDGKNENGRYVPSGIYFYRLTAGKFRQTNKMILLR